MALGLTEAAMAPSQKNGPVTLSVDIGASHFKAGLLDPKGKMISTLVKRDTPRRCTPRCVETEIRKLAEALSGFDRVSIGFPGRVRDGLILSAPNLSERAWSGYPLARRLEKILKKPARILNDADMHGLAAIKGRGLELVVTLGTGLGTSLFENGRLLPHLELGLAFGSVKKRGEDCDEFLGNRARKRIGSRRWNRRLRKAVKILFAITHYDRIYFGGGNAKRIKFRLEPDMCVIPNRDGILGGIALWKNDEARRTLR